MKNLTSRRSVMLAIPTAVVAPLLIQRLSFGADTPTEAANNSFPSQDRNLVREMVGASHGKVARVKELLAKSPRLANATYDWGFGDWEAAIGAASHVGNREIAEILLAHGARGDIFTHAMLGNLEVVRATVTAMPGIERVRGPHGLTLAHHARQGEASAVIEYLKTLPGADIPYTDLPLTDEQKDVYLGSYRFGERSDEAFDIQLRKNGSLSIKRVGGFEIRLFHQGENRFHPAGAPEVILAFTVDSGKATQVRIASPGDVCLGIRSG
ncbi:MAG: hypothetical protein ACREJC_20195 [Tepidisphaeraceae bacterium]